MKNHHYATEVAMSEAKIFASEFLSQKKDEIEKTLKSGGRHLSQTKMTSKQYEGVGGCVDLYCYPDTVSLDMYVFIPGDEEPEVVFFTFTQKKDSIELLASSEAFPKANKVEVDTIPAFKELEEMLTETFSHL